MTSLTDMPIPFEDEYQIERIIPILNAVDRIRAGLGSGGRDPGDSIRSHHLFLDPQHGFSRAPPIGMVGLIPGSPLSRQSSFPG